MGILVMAFLRVVVYVWYLRVNFQPVEFDIWLVEGQLWLLKSNYRPLGLYFRFLGVELGTLRVVFRPLGINNWPLRAKFRPLGVDF